MKVTCQHCALPFAVARVTPGRAVYCCSGCALAARVTVDGQGNFPINAALVTALGVGFFYFNQVLFWLLAVLVARTEDGAAGAAPLGWASLALGAVAWLALGYFQLREGARRGADLALAAGVGALLACGAAGGGAAVAAGANALWMAWCLRGLVRGRRALV